MGIREAGTEGFPLVAVVVPHIRDPLWDGSLELIAVGNQPLQLGAAT